MDTARVRDLEERWTRRLAAKLIPRRSDELGSETDVAAYEQEERVRFSALTPS